MEFLKEMALVLLVDAVASSSEDKDDSKFDNVEGLIVSGCDLMDTVPLALARCNMSLDNACAELLPEMKRIVAEIDAVWAGKLTLQELAEEFGSKVYTTSALFAMGHGVSLDDDNEIALLLEVRGVSIPEVQISGDLVWEAVWGI